MHTIAVLMAALSLASLANAEDNTPRALAQPLPAFPPVFVGQPARPVEVTVVFVVDETGTPRQIRIRRSTDRQLENNAAAAVSRWRFQPAETHGRKISARMTALVTFHPDRTITSEIEPR